MRRTDVMNNKETMESVHLLYIRYSMSEANDTTRVVCLLPASLHVHACTSNACS